MCIEFFYKVNNFESQLFPFLIVCHGLATKMCLWTKLSGVFQNNNIIYYQMRMSAKVTLGSLIKALPLIRALATNI